MKQLLILLSWGVISFPQWLQSEKHNTSGQIKTSNESAVLHKMEERIQGDFIGNGRRGYAAAVKIAERQGNPVEGGTADQYEIRFSDSRIKSIMVGCCKVRLINEGDLNHDKADEISVFQAPMNGCTYSMTTYSYKNGSWNKVVATFLIPTGCEMIRDQDLQQRVFLEKGTIYYYVSDPNRSGKLIKKKAMIRKT
ncbi:hypothetical protein H9X96_20855 [Pedobacter sp. N36a]|uniref:hypothetical protein n=1 Tax=Pedobacter sp. N36a TaxID=2767996 RepID=UPI0016569806|nr:hypothetical protein [Pedobacter sp. N36a]MBC8988211.1 hypothetical protein [Pedobacter sp. N36a]